MLEKELCGGNLDHFFFEIMLPTCHAIYRSIDTVIVHRFTFSAKNKKQFGPAVARFKNLVWRNIVFEVCDVYFHYGIETVTHQVLDGKETGFGKLPFISLSNKKPASVDDFMQLIAFMIEEGTLMVWFQKKPVFDVQHRNDPLFMFEKKEKTIPVGNLRDARPLFLLKEFRRPLVSGEDHVPGALNLKGVDYVHARFTMVELISLFTCGQSNFFSRKIKETVSEKARRGLRAHFDRSITENDRINEDWLNLAAATRTAFSGRGSLRGGGLRKSGKEMLQG